MKRLFLIIGLTSLGAMVSWAQESSDTLIERNVDVVKEYNPVIKDAGKSYHPDCRYIPEK